MRAKGFRARKRWQTIPGVLWSRFGKWLRRPEGVQGIQRKREIYDCRLSGRYLLLSFFWCGTSCWKASDGALAFFSSRLTKVQLYLHEHWHRGRIQRHQWSLMEASPGIAGGQQHAYGNVSQYHDFIRSTSSMPSQNANVGGHTFPPCRRYHSHLPRPRHSTPPPSHPPHPSSSSYPQSAQYYPQAHPDAPLATNQTPHRSHPPAP